MPLQAHFNMSRAEGEVVAFRNALVNPLITISSFRFLHILLHLVSLMHARKGHKVLIGELVFFLNARKNCK